jgi:hypothetical protein
MASRSDRPPSLNVNPSSELSVIGAGQRNPSEPAGNGLQKQAGYKTAALSVGHHTEKTLPSGGVHIKSHEIVDPLK